MEDKHGYEILIDSKSDALAALRNAEVKVSSAIKMMTKAERDKHDLENALALIESTYDWIYKQVHGEFDEELDEADAEIEQEQFRNRRCSHTGCDRNPCFDDAAWHMQIPAKATGETHVH